MQASGSLSAGTTQPDRILRPYKVLRSTVTFTFPASLSVLTSLSLCPLDRHVEHHPLGHSWADQYLSGCLSWAPVELGKNVSTGEVWAQAARWSKGPSKDVCLGRACMCTRQGILHPWGRGNVGCLASRRDTTAFTALLLLQLSYCTQCSSTHGMMSLVGTVWP